MRIKVHVCRTKPNVVIIIERKMVWKTTTGNNTHRLIRFKLHVLLGTAVVVVALGNTPRAKDKNWKMGKTTKRRKKSVAVTTLHTRHKQSNHNLSQLRKKTIGGLSWADPSTATISLSWWILIVNCWIGAAAVCLNENWFLCAVSSIVQFDILITVSMSMVQRHTTMM